MKKFTRTIHIVEVAAIKVNVSDMTMHSENVQLFEVDANNTKSLKKELERLGYDCDMVKVVNELDALYECTVEEFLSVAHITEK